MTEADLIAAILIEFGARPEYRLFRRNTGAARTSTGALVRFGLPGMADIWGIQRGTGRLIEIETKAPNGRQTREQRKWQAMCEAFNVIYVCARSVEDVRAVLGRD